MEFQKDFTQCIPSSNKAIDLSLWINQKLSKSFKHLLEEIKSATDIPVKKSLESVNSLSSGSYINSHFYIAHDTLFQAMQREDITAIKSALLTLNTDKHYNPLEVLYDKEFFKLILDLSIIDEPSISINHFKEFNTEYEEIFKAFSILEQVDQDAYDETKALLNKIVLCSTKLFKGLSSFRFLGTMLLAVPEELPNEEKVVYFLEWIVHETAHMYLHALLTSDPFLLNDPSETYSSPIRPDPRPIIQVLHAAFVLQRVLHVFKKAQNQYPSDETYHKLFTKKFEETKPLFDDALNTVLKNGKTTTIGKEFVQSLVDWKKAYL